MWQSGYSSLSQIADMRPSKQSRHSVDGPPRQTTVLNPRHIDQYSV